MGRRCALVMDEMRLVELERLSRSGLRAEADRARVVLWSRAGETSGSIAVRLGARAEQVRRWRERWRGTGWRPYAPGPGRDGRRVNAKRRWQWPARC
jgi:transposase